ncbi:GyrI-like domain-containing protein [Paenibacillus sp. NPDC058174]|uniref:GyrI-like domain-containing protein n=1 Tax=Paenibacillus sp. NPDC058174 TaxID=3346366 RepID=UPI0036DB2A75
MYETRIVWESETQVVGEIIRFDPSIPALPSENEISALWPRFMSRVPEIRNAAGGTYGLNLFGEGCLPGGPFHYMAGIGVEPPSADSLPEGMDTVTIPAGLYAVVTRKGVIDGIRDAFRYYWEEWLPASGYVTRSSGIEYEYYDDRYLGNDNPESVMEIWCPIELAQPAPVENRVASVFVHVTDLRRSAEWYSTLLGLPLREERLDGPVYWFELEGTQILLDSNVNNRRNPDWHEEMKPRLMLATNDIDGAYRYAQELGEPFTEPQHFDPVAFFTFRDPEGNSLMVCRNLATAEATIRPSADSPVTGIGGVFLDVKEVASAARWYSKLFGLPLEESRLQAPIYPIPVTKGAALLLDGNRHRNQEQFTELFYFETEDFDRALTFIREHGIELASEPQHFDDLSEVTLLDPDGNRIVIAAMKR